MKQIFWENIKINFFIFFKKFSIFGLYILDCFISTIKVQPFFLLQIFIIICVISYVPYWYKIYILWGFVLSIITEAIKNIPVWSNSVVFKHCVHDLSKVKICILLNHVEKNLLGLKLYVLHHFIIYNYVLIIMSIWFSLVHYELVDI